MAGVIGLLAAAPVHLGGGSPLGVSLTRIVLALVLCSGLAIAVALLLKRGGGRIDLAGWRPVGPIRAGRRIEVIETRRISPHADICLLRCDGRDYLILNSAVAQQVLRQGPAA